MGHRALGSHGRRQSVNEQVKERLNQHWESSAGLAALTWQGWWGWRGWRGQPQPSPWDSWGGCSPAHHWQLQLCDTSGHLGGDQRGSLPRPCNPSAQPGWAWAGHPPFPPAPAELRQGHRKKWSGWGRWQRPHRSPA